MTKEDKQLLFKDLCARLPYDVIVHTWYNKPLDIKCTSIDLYTNTINLDIPDDDEAKVYIDNCKPYLRPMSSMTEEEKEEVRRRFCDELEESIMELYYSIEIRDFDCFIDWLNEHHFDYRGLIEKGLALEAPMDMYKTE